MFKKNSLAEEKIKDLLNLLRDYINEKKNTFDYELFLSHLRWISHLRWWNLKKNKNPKMESEKKIHNDKENILYSYPKVIIHQIIIM